MTDMELIQALRDENITDAGDMMDYMEEAADRLESLLAENELLKAQVPKWRPVSEPPTETGEYLVDLGEEKAVLRFPVEKVPFVPAGNWYRKDDYGYPEVIRKKEIKSWMPLPITEETK